MTERLAVTVAEAAQLLGCSRWHVADLVRDGVLPRVPHMGRRIFIPTWAIDDLVGRPSTTPRQQNTPETPASQAGLGGA